MSPRLIFYKRSRMKRCPFKARKKSQISRFFTICGFDFFIDEQPCRRKFSYLMRKLLLILLTSVLTLPAIAQVDAFAGFYKGKITLANGAELKKGYPISMYPEIYAEVYRGPEAKYRVKILTGILSRAEASAMADNLSEKDGKIPFDIPGFFSLKGNVTPEAVVATGRYANQDIKIDLKRLNYKSPTLGQKAPAGAVVLYDGGDPSENWELISNRSMPVNWIVKDGAMTVKTDAKKPDGKRMSTSIESKKAFGKSKLHIEFNIPPMYEQLSQARANSGVFFGPYEIQVLDSFGAEGTWDNCGSLYRQTPSQFNASLEPGAWQTYDIIYTPAKYEGDKCVADPTFTVYHNGRRVQYETPVPYSTSMPLKKAHTFKHPKEPVKLQLQDHTNPVSFRNIWIQPLD